MRGESKRQRRKQLNGSLGYGWQYHYHKKNRYLDCAIQGSKGDKIVAMVRGNKILWHYMTGRDGLDA